MYLNEAIESVLEQSYEDIEIIIVLNNAQAWVEDYLKKFSTQDKRFRILKTKEKGISNALNMGLKSAKHSLVCRLDSDDLMDPERIGKQVRFLSDNPNIGVVGSQIKKITAEGEFIGESSFPTKSADVKTCLTIRNVIAHSSVMFRKEIIEEAGGYLSSFNGAEDYELWMRLRTNTKFTNLGEALTTYRVWPEQGTSKNKVLTHYLVRLIHTREFGGLTLEPFPSGLELEEIRTLSQKYLIQSFRSAVSKKKIGVIVRLLGAISVDAGIEKMKFKQGALFIFIGALQVLAGALIFAEEIFKIFLLPLIRAGASNAKH